MRRFEFGDNKGFAFIKIKTITVTQKYLEEKEMSAGAKHNLLGVVKSIAIKGGAAILTVAVISI